MFAKPRSTQNSRWNRFGFLVTVGVVVLVSSLYIYLPGGWAWETPIARSFPAVVIDVPPMVGTVTMTLEDAASADISLAIAPTEAAVRDFWTSASVAQVEGTTLCNGTSKDAGGMHCNRSGAALTIRIPPDVTNGKATERKTFWVVPYVETSFKTIHTVTSLRWTKLDVTSKEGTKIIEVDAASCLQPEERIARERCIFADELLGRPQLSQSRNPERLVANLARWSAHQIVPVLVTVMAIVDAMLAISIIALIGVWLRGKGIGQPPRDGQPIDSFMLLPGYRNVMTLLETLGPSVAFSTTVLGLILAFDPSVFADRDGSAFGNAIRMAMGASFCGLAMKVLALCADRLIEHLTKWNAAEDGLIYPIDGPHDSGSSDMADEDRISDTEARSAQPKIRKLR